MASAEIAGGQMGRFIFALVSLIVAFLTLSASVASPFDTAPNRYVKMAGVGVVKAMPDTAVVSGGVAAKGKNAGEALRSSRLAMAKATAALKAIGIVDKQITTESFLFAPQYARDAKGNIDTRTIVGYTVTNRIVVTLSQLERAGDVLDALIENGASDSTSLSFELRDTEALEMQARALAGKNALERAQVYVKSIGAVLGAVRSVREGDHNDSEELDFSAPVMSAPSSSVAVQSSPVPPPTRVEAGEQTITQVVTVVWDLK